MKKTIFAIISCIICFVVQAQQNNLGQSIPTVKIDTLHLGKFSIRAIAVSDGKIYYAANKNRVGYVDIDTKSKFERQINKDSLEFEFRSLAISGNSVFALTIANPALLYKFSKDLQQKQLVYEERHEKVFYDSMQFWNTSEGIAMGDPVDGCFSVIITRDGGNSWQKIPCGKLPKLAEGEAAFAASNTNIVVKGDKTWLVSGGTKARVFHSPDKGKSWKVIDTPIVQGEATTGIYTADFYNEKIGFIAGGDYKNPFRNLTNKGLTKDGGKTWKQPVSQDSGFGYASCIQFAPDSNGKELLCVGATGIHYTKDQGYRWDQIAVDNTLYTLRFIDRYTAIAAGKDKIIRIVLPH